MTQTPNLDAVLKQLGITPTAATAEATRELAALRADALLGRLVRQAVEAGFGDIVVDHTLHCDDNRLFDGCTCGAWTHQAVIDAALEGIANVK